MITVTCRLADLLKEKLVGPEELAVASGLPLERVQSYCAGDVDAVFLREAGAILSALGCSRVSELFELTFAPDADAGDADAPTVYETDWDSPCPASPDGKHNWYKDMAASDTVYQEFTCPACGRKLSLIL